MKLACVLFLLLSTVPTIAQKSETMTIRVYFHPDKVDPNVEDCQKVAPVNRTIPKTTAVATAALQELFKGPTAAEAKEYSAMGPPDTNGILKSVNVKKGAAYVNFTKLVYEQMGTATTSCGGGFFSMVEATLTQFPTIKKVYYAIEGNTNDFYEWVQVGECPHGKKNCSAANFIN
ncbi:MAG TPA: GerMN domain-containing protein [Pyrinomonadaceae bacterium]|nr:GerMN domain-containing protein [Pyrinomonadaceae bacterium]